MNKRSARASSSKQQQKNNAERSSGRRSQISELCSELTSCIPPQYVQDSKNVRSQADQVEQVTNYIVALRERVDGLQRRKDQLELMMVNQEGTSSQRNTNINEATMANLPIIEVKDLGDCSEVQLVMEQEHCIMLHEVIRVLEEEGAEVVNSSSSISGNNVFYTLHAKSFSLDKWTGKKCYMLGARELSIVAGDNPRCWRWKPLSESRFPEVAELLGVAHLYITGRISTQLLSPNTTYHMYFSFMLGAWSRGFDTFPVKVFVSRIDSNGAYIGGSSYDAPKTFYLKAPENDAMYDSFEGEEVYEHRREGGHRWIKIDMGKYFNRLDGDGGVAIVEMTLMGTEVGLHKTGLIVHGIELLPLD